MKRQLRRGLTIVAFARAAIRRLAGGGLWLLMLAFVHCILGQVSAAPINDTCAGAELIPGAGPFPHVTAVTDITTATLSLTDPPITNSFLSTRVIRSVWYRFTPAATALYTVTTCSDAGAATTVEDTVLGIYTSAGGCNGPFTPLGLGDEDCGPNSSQASVTMQLLADTTYYILIWKYCDNCTDDGLNNLQLVIEGSIPPPNDNCGGAIPVLLDLPVEGTTVGAEDTYRVSGTSAFWGIDQTPSMAMGRDVVYSFTAPQATNYSFKVTSYDMNQNLVLHIAPNCPAGLPPISIASSLGAANRSGVNSAEEVFCLGLAAGQQVFVIVDDNNPGNPGSGFILEVTRCVREGDANNTPSEASPFACGIEGSSSPTFDVDFYSLGRFPAGWRAFVLVDGEAARIANYDLRITTVTNTLEYDDDNNDSVFGDSSPNVAGTPLTDEPAFISINYFGGAEREPYRIHAVVQPPLAAAVPEVEPNNTWSQANSADQNYFYGTLDGPGVSTDVDLFTFSVAEGDLIFLSLDGDPYRTNAPINARLELLDPAGNSVVIVNDDGSSSFGSTNIAINTLTAFGPSSPSEGLIYRSAVEGTFYARVSISSAAAGNSGSGYYLLSISKNCVIGSDGLNHSPTLTNINLASSITVGAVATLTGTIWETDLGDATTLTVNWGDGTTNRIDYPTPGRLYFSAPHQFNISNTNFTVTLTATDSRGGASTVTTNIQVRVQSAAARFTSINPLPSGQFNLQLLGTPTGLYRIEKCNTLGVAWTELGTRTASATGAFTIDDPSPAPISRFYRAVTVP